MKFSRLLVLMLVVVLALTTVGITTAQDDLGTPENPIQVFFVPSVEAQVLIEGGELLQANLEEATGLSFEVVIPTSYAATIEAMCAAPGSSMGFIPAAGYVIAHERCGIEPGAAAVRFGWPVYWAQYTVRRDSDIYTFGDLDGKTWAYPDPGSTSGFVVPSVELQAAGITPGDTVEAGGHPQAVLAVYNGEADFATSYFSPPLTPGAAWDFGDPPEPYDLTIDEAFVTDEGRLFVGDIRILDARSAVTDTAPDVIENVRILRISAPIPNDTMSFGPDFPQEMRDQIFEGLLALTEREDWEQTSLGNQDEGYNWTSLARVEDDVFDSVRLQMSVLGMTEEDIFEED